MNEWMNLLSNAIIIIVQVYSHIQLHKKARIAWMLVKSGPLQFRQLQSIFLSLLLFSNVLLLAVISNSSTYYRRKKTD